MTSNRDLFEVRQHYHNEDWCDSELPNSPFEWFGQWLNVARESKAIREPNACNVATLADHGRVRSRMVLLKQWDERGMVFYSNYDSAKGRELAYHAQAALCFWWEPLMWQVRIEGCIQHTDADESDAYFKSRPKASQVSAVLSPQSDVIESRQWLLNHVDTYEPLSTGDLARPHYWGGFRLVPDRFEFWQGRENRLHDRMQYTRKGDVWRRERLAP